jgi:hypothetical protein
LKENFGLALRLIIISSQKTFLKLQQLRVCACTINSFKNSTVLAVVGQLQAEFQKNDKIRFTYNRERERKRERQREGEGERDDDQKVLKTEV